MISNKKEVKLIGTLVITVLFFAACSVDNELAKTPPVTTSATSTSTTSTISPETSNVTLWTGDPIVRTQYGDVRGFEDEENTWVWKAIPYAKPPIGDLRWKAPQRPEPWDGIREETDFCDLCPQYDPLTQETVIGNEDCLYLNVWRPQSTETGLPVYVWIHGGQSVASAAEAPTYYGTHIANKANMVFVSIDFRIGPLGWFTHPALRTGMEGDELDDSGNYGTLDLIESLEWIQNSIEAFGGDPDNVIITGESAGAENCWSLMLSPLAEGLFHKVIARSGMEVSHPMEYGDDTANNVLLQLLVNDRTASDIESAQVLLNDMPNTEIADYLRSKTPAELLACYEKLYFGFIAFPFIYEDGTVVHAEGFDAFRTGDYPNKVPMIMGTTKEEYKLFMFQNESLVGKDELYQVVASYGSQLWKADAEGIATNLSLHADQPDVYFFQFDWGSGGDIGESPIPEPHGFKIGAAHSLDSAFFLGTQNFFGPLSSEILTEENRFGREALTDAIVTYTAQFARTGNPNDPEDSLPDWKPWTNKPNEPKCILFNADLDTAKIEMSPKEYSKTGVLESMQEEIPEPLYSEVFNYLLSETITSYLLRNIDIEPYTPLISEEPSSEPTTTLEPLQSPKPTQTPKASTKWKYFVNYDDEDTVWTVSITGEENVDDVDCYVTETSYDVNPVRRMYAEEQGIPVLLTLKEETVSLDKKALQPVKADVVTILTTFNWDIGTTTTFNYDGPYGAPLSVGQTWSYTQVDVLTLGDALTSTWTAEVVGMEEITVPAGTFNCYKTIFTSGNKIRTVWSSAEDDMFASIKVVDEGIWTYPETRILASYIEE